MTEPKEIHAADQVIARMRTMGAGFAAMMEELMEKGTPAREASRIVREYIANTFANTFTELDLEVDDDD